MFAKGSLSGAVKIRTEADAAIGSTGVPIGKYIQENQGAASKPLLDDASNDWIEKLYEAQELSPEGIVMGEPAPSRMPYDTSWKSSYYGRYPDTIGAMGLNSVSDDEESEGYLDYESESDAASASELTDTEMGPRSAQAAADNIEGLFDGTNSGPVNRFTVDPPSRITGSRRTRAEL